MSDLEEENRPAADAASGSMHSQSEDQIGIVSGSRTGFFCSARQVYYAVPIPEELNTRVRAVIESDRESKRQHFFRLAAAAAAAASVCCFLTPAVGFLFRREIGMNKPSRQIAESSDTVENRIHDFHAAESETALETVLQTDESTREPIGVRIRKLRKK